VPGTAVLLITPEGNGPPLDSLGLVISATVFDCDGSLLRPSTAPDPHLVPEGSGVVACGNWVADDGIDIEGHVQWSDALAGGGWADGSTADDGRVRLKIGEDFTALTFQVKFVSPDINGDLRIDLSDVGTFAADFATAPVDFRSDFNADGLENLADIGILAAHLGESCP
jgi:hypothetical protein